MGGDSLNISPKVREIEAFLAREDNQVVDWAMLATNLALELANHSPLKRDWVVYFKIRDHKNKLKEERNWKRQNHKIVLDNLDN
jgi:hypothetical protein